MPSLPRRARKADIVQLILELTGVEPAGGGGSPDAEANGRKEATVDDADTPAPAAETESTPAPEAAPAPARGGCRGAVRRRAAVRVGDGVRRHHRRRRPARGPTADNGKGGGGANGESRNGDTRQAEPGGVQAGQQGGDGEPGNRRRRRRGRRGKEDAPAQAEEFSGEPVEVEGLLDLRDEGYGFLRVKGYLPTKDDVYVSVKQVRQFGLRKGDHIKGASRPGDAQREEPGPAAHRHGQRRRSRAGPPAPPVRGPDPAVPRREAARWRPIDEPPT